ncbi:MAG: ABC transporter substrate-binding protein [Candidatus Rokuibacteriota bacterium]|nr:MAG: ABC transporter substrate-binding protein [Candidatus Rokubacteria bacterium]
MMIRRRALAVAVLLGLLAVPLAVRAQPAGKPYRVGVLSGSSAVADPAIQAFRESLQALGWVDGRNIAIELRFADGHMDRLASLAAELVRLDVRVIVAGPSTVAQAARQATATIPIVMTGVGDPVKLGFVKSLSHPGGNMTGLASLLPELEAKSFQLLAELVPGLTSVAVLLNPDNPLHDVKDAEAAAKLVGLQLVTVRARTPEEFTAAFDAIVKAHAGAVDIWGDPVFGRHRTALIDHAMRSRLPTMFKGKPNVVAGGLVAYGPDFVDIYRRAASYVDKILRGIKPADLPVEQPTKLELIINLKTAKALGLTIPPLMLLRADQVIE